MKNNELKKTDPLIYIVTPVYNRRSVTERFLENIAILEYSNFKQIIIDDGSKDGTSELIKEKFPWVILLQGDGNLFWSGGTNAGVKHALKNNADHILTLNDDTLFSSRFLQELLDKIRDRTDIIAAPAIGLEHDHSRIWMAGTSRTILGISGMYKNMPEVKLPKTAYEVDAHTGMCVLYPAGVFQKAGFFDEKNFPLREGDTDFTLRCRNFGFRNVLFPDIRIYNDVSTLYQNNPYLKVSFEKFWQEMWKHGSTHNIKHNVIFFNRHWGFPLMLIPFTVKFIRYWLFCFFVLVFPKKMQTRIKNLYRKLFR